MPHLDFSYFLSQIFWSIFVFLLIYLTIAKRFCAKYGEIIHVRKHKVSEYLNKTNKTLKKISEIEKQIDKSKKDAADEAKRLEEGAKKEMLAIQSHRLNAVKSEIESKNIARALYLNGLKNDLLIDLRDYSKDINEKLTSYLFER